MVSITINSLIQYEFQMKWVAKLRIMFISTKKKSPLFDNYLEDNSELHHYTHVLHNQSQINFLALKGSTFAFSTVCYNSLGPEFSILAVSFDWKPSLHSPP